MKPALGHLGVWFMRGLAHLPLPLVRGLGACLGWALWLIARRRRRIAATNLGLCFPHRSSAERRRWLRRHFVCFAQAWLDRSWLWHAPASVVRARLSLQGQVSALLQPGPIVILAPHFVGLDAGWTALTLLLERRMCTLYAEQLNPQADGWILQGRQRFGAPRVLARRQGMRAVVQALRAGEPFYLLPDMDHGARDAVFVPFFGVPAATVTSLSRVSRLAGATVVPVTARLSASGYEVEVHPPWSDAPTEDATADTALMNLRLQAWIETMPEQYYWVHKRFKTRPSGEPDVYADI